MDRLFVIGKKYGIFVIEDVVEVIGLIYYGNCVGLIVMFGVFLFYGIKMFIIGEGGMFVINELDLYEYVFMLSNYGWVRV